MATEHRPDLAFDRYRRGREWIEGYRAAREQDERDGTRPRYCGDSRSAAERFYWGVTGELGQTGER